MTYIKFMPGRSLQHASRNKRELQAASELGYKIKVVSSDSAENFHLLYPEYELVQDGTIKLSYSMPRVKRYAYIIKNYFVHMRTVRRTEGNIISCHDLDSLLLCFLALLFKKNKPELIYDSHEFEIGRNKKRNRLQLWWVTHLERFLIKRCAFSIMVNDAIAEEVQRIHGLKECPVVVRSTPNLWAVDADACAQVRKELLSGMQSPTDFMLMYHGAVMAGRGIETLLEVVSVNPNTCAVVIGNDEGNYLNFLKVQAKRLNVQERVVFHPAVPIEKLWKYVGAADVGMVTIPAVAKSYYYMLPNKFFENIQSETPVICSDFPAVAPIVNKYLIGLTCDPTDINAINACVERMRTDKEFYSQCKDNLMVAKQELCWEKEKEVFKRALKEHFYE